MRYGRLLLTLHCITECHTDKKKGIQALLSCVFVMRSAKGYVVSLLQTLLFLLAAQRSAMTW